MVDGWMTGWEATGRLQEVLVGQTRVEKAEKSRSCQLFSTKKASVRFRCFVISWARPGYAPLFVMNAIVGADDVTDTRKL